MRASITSLLTILVIGSRMSNSTLDRSPCQLKWPDRWPKEWQFHIFNTVMDDVPPIWGPVRLDSLDSRCTLTMEPAMAVSYGDRVTDQIHLTMRPHCALSIQATSTGFASYVGHTVALHNKTLNELLVMYLARDGDHEYETQKIQHWNLARHEVNVWRIGTTPSSSSAHDRVDYKKPVLYFDPRRTS